MYRKTKVRESASIVNLDSLMDILSCLVGVMLFLVIYTVLELGTATYTAEVPLVRNPPVGSQRVVVVADHGTVRILDVREPLQVLLSGLEIVRLNEMPIFVDQANERAPSDRHFSYSLNYENRANAFDSPLVALDLVIQERPGFVGDSIHQLGDGSSFAASLADLRPQNAWLAFVVESTSVDVFRRAREIAVEKGFATGWDLFSVVFPLAHALSDGGVDDLLSTRMIVSKPER